MSIFTITYESRCKHCHFLQNDYYTYKRRVLFKCMYGIEKVPFESEVHKGHTHWTKEQVKSATGTTQRTKACKNFIMFGVSEEQVQEILKDRQVDQVKEIK